MRFRLIACIKLIKYHCNHCLEKNITVIICQKEYHFSQREQIFNYQIIKSKLHKDELEDQTLQIIQKFDYNESF